MLGHAVYMQGVLVANRRSLTERPAQLLPVVHELLERLDAHLKAEDFYSGERLCSGLGSRVQFFATRLDPGGQCHCCLAKMSM